MRVLFLLASCIFLVACAAPGQIVLSDQPASQTTFRLTDARTPMSRAGVVEGIGGRTSYGDGNLKPAPPELVSAWLQEALANELRGRHVVLENFDFGAQSSFVSNPGVAPGAAAMHSLMAPTLVFLRIDGKVDERAFSVGVNDRVAGALTDERLKAMLAQAKIDLIREVRRAAAGS